MTSNAAARGPSDKADFADDHGKDVYACPAGEPLTYRYAGHQDGKAIRSYWSGACAECPIKTGCTTGSSGACAPSDRCKQRLPGSGWEHEDVLQRVQDRRDADPTQLAIRSMTVEHSYDTISHGWAPHTSK